MPTPTWAHLLRAFTSVWRFQTLRIARLVFRHIERPCTLSRPFAGHRLCVDVSRTNAQRRLFLEGERFVKEKNLLKRVVEPGMTVIEVGANIGYYMILLSTTVGSDGSVVCFEPDPDNFKELSVNKSRNGLDNATLVQKAVGSRSGKVAISPGLNARVDDEGSIEVEMTTIDNSVMALKPEAIKIDVEGYEGAVLEGAKRTIDRYRPNIFLEIHPWLSTNHGYRQIFSFLKDRYSVAFYETEREGLFEKLRQRYWGSSTISKLSDHRHLLSDCVEGRRQTPFWAIATPE